MPGLHAEFPVPDKRQALSEIHQSYKDISTLRTAIEAPEAKMSLKIPDDAGDEDAKKSEKCI